MGVLSSGAEAEDLYPCRPDTEAEHTGLVALERVELGIWVSSSL